jgi:hypothetical protein
VGVDFPFTNGLRADSACLTRKEDGNACVFALLLLFHSIYQ